MAGYLNRSLNSLERKPSGCRWLPWLDGIGGLCVYRGWPVGGADGARRDVVCCGVGAGGAVARIFAKIASLGDIGDIGDAAGGGALADGIGEGAALVGVDFPLMRASASWLDVMGALGRTPGPAKRRWASASEINAI